MSAGVYKIQNRINHKVYIGETNDFKRRWSEHKRLLRKGQHHCKRLQKEWNKYGERCFKFRVVERFWFAKRANKDKLNIALLLREGYWIDIYNALLDFNTEDTISDLKRFADMGYGNPKFSKYKRYRKFIQRHISFAKHWKPHILIASLYNPYIKLFLNLILMIGVILICLNWQLVLASLWRCINYLNG